MNTCFMCSVYCVWAPPGGCTRINEIYFRRISVSPYWTRQEQQGLKTGSRPAAGQFQILL